MGFRVYYIYIYIFFFWGGGSGLEELKFMMAGLKIPGLL